MVLKDLIDAMEAIAPTKYAEAWDNVGLLIGDPGDDLRKVMLAIDYTDAVHEEMIDVGASAVVAYHPPIFDGLKRVGSRTLVGRTLAKGFAVYSPHTALDVAEGGTNDLLADVMGVGERWPLKVAAGKSTQYKLVTFVPEAAVEAVSEAMFRAGAGRIGAYSACSFRSPGTGTFFGNESTKPAVGTKGRLERQPEVRVETVVPVASLECVVKALKDSHPYEEPAFDLNVLAAAPVAVGIGRVGVLRRAVSRRVLIDRVKKELGLAKVLVAGPTSGTVTKVACCAGAGRSLLDEAVREEVGLYLTGELPHHDALRAARAGVTVVCTLHSNSERPVLPRVKRELEKRLKGVPVVVSKKDRDPFSIA